MRGSRPGNCGWTVKKIREITITRSDNQPKVFNLRWEEDGALHNWTFATLEKALAHVRKIFARRGVERIVE